MTRNSWSYPELGDRAVEPRGLYGPRVAELRNQAPTHTGAPPAQVPHSSAQTRHQAPKTAGNNS